MLSPFSLSSRFRFTQRLFSCLQRGTALTLMTVFGVWHAVAQAPATAPAHPVVAAEEREAAPVKDDASHQNITVHGHWKIVVKNPDGSVAQTREFENSLVSANLLALLLTGKNTPGQFAIDLIGTGTGQGVCGAANCYLIPNLGGIYVPLACSAANQNWNCTTGLTTTTSANGLQAIYAGQLTASQTASITRVTTIGGYCDPSTTTTNCAVSGTATNSAANFTGTTISTISVNSGQIVQVTVTISFS